jgi:hypothetical protein
VQISSDSASVTIGDSGRAFGIDALRSGGKGGNRAALDLGKHASGTFVLIYRSQDSRNCPGELWSYSDWAMLLDTLSRVAADRAFVVNGVNENEHIDFIAEFFPAARIAD